MVKWVILQKSHVYLHCCHPTPFQQPVQQLFSSKRHHRLDMEQYEFLHTCGPDSKDGDTMKWMDKKNRKNVFYSCRV